MKTIEISEAKSSLADYADRIAEAPLIITNKGKPVAALIALENADLETISLSTNPEFMALIGQSRVRQETEGSISSQEIRRKLGVK